MAILGRQLAREPAWASALARRLVVALVICALPLATASGQDEARENSRTSGESGSKSAAAPAERRRSTDVDDLEALFGTAEEPEENPEPAPAEPSESSQAQERPTITLDDEEPPGLARPKPDEALVIEEIIVTANRRLQSLHDIAGSISAIDGEKLERLNIDDLEGLVFRIPGVDVNVAEGKQIAIRGIGNPAGYGPLGSRSAVGVYLNDTPIGGSGFLPDLDLYDLQRVEILKGPQGTLYGEGAQGGAVRMLLAPPDPGVTLFKVDVGAGQTRYGDGFNNFQKAAINLPLIQDEWGARLVLTRKWDSGYIDYFNQGQEHANDQGAQSARLQLDGSLFKDLRVSVLGMVERQELDQFTTSQPAEGDLRNRVYEDQFQKTRFGLASLSLSYDFGFAELTSASALRLHDYVSRARFPFFESLRYSGGCDVPLICAPLPAGGQALQEWANIDTAQTGITEELRLVSPGGGWFSWIGGIFLRSQEDDFTFLLDNSASTDLPPPVGPGFIDAFGTLAYRQIALFGEIVLAFGPGLEATFGLRGLQETVDFEITNYARGPFYPFDPAGEGYHARHKTPTRALTPKASLSWDIDADRMVYFSVSNGVRSGGANYNSAQTSTQALFEPDWLWTYEAGLKADWFGSRLTTNLSVFHNQWTDLQIHTVQTGAIGPPGVPGVVPAPAIVIVNVGDAYSRGVELEVMSVPLPGLTSGLSLLLGEAEIVKGSPEGGVPDHSPLPQFADLAAAAYASYRPPSLEIFGLTPSINLDVQYVGERNGRPGPYPLRAFRTVNLSAGFGNGIWDVSVGVQNLTDERQELGSLSLQPDDLTIGRPRTWSAKLAMRW